MSSACHTLFSVRRGLRADVVLREDAASGQDQREPAGGALVGRHEFGDHEAALAAHESTDVHHRRAFGSLGVARPLDAAEFVDLLEADAGEGRREARDLVHDFGRMRCSSSDSRARWKAPCVISQSAMPAMGGIALRTRLMRRSALVNVPSFSRNDDPGKKTCA